MGVRKWGVACDGMNGNGPYELIYLNVWFPVSGLLRSNRSCDLVVEGTSLEVEFEVSKVHSIPSPPLDLTLSLFHLLLVDKICAPGYCSSTMSACHYTFYHDVCLRCF